MDLSITIGEIEQLSIDDRICLVQAIWDSIAAEDVQPELSDEQKEVLDRRIAELDAAPENVITWEEIKAQITGR